MLSAVLVITILSNPLLEPHRVPVATMKQCRVLMDTPGAWWTLRDDVQVRCDRNA